MRIARKMWLIMLAFVLLGTIQWPTPSLAADAVKKIIIDGKEVQYTQQPITRHQTTLVSARETLEALGYKFTWDKANKRIIAISSTGETTLTFIMGEISAMVNGMTIVLDSVVVEENGRIMIPLRPVVKALGASMKADSTAIRIQTVAEEKGPYYTGLPLEITNTYVKNTGKRPITLGYDLLLMLDGEFSTKFYAVDSLPGKKVVLEFASARPSEVIEIEGVTYVFLGRALNSAAIWDQQLYEDDDPELYVIPSYDRVYEHFNSGKLIDEFLVWLDRYEAERRANRQAELKKNKNVPLRVDKTYVQLDQYSNYPVAHIELTNLTEKTIVGFEAEFYCYDAKGRAVKRSGVGSNKVLGQSTNDEVEPGWTATRTIDLYLYDNTTTIKNVTVTKVIFADGTVWKKK